MKKLKTAVLIIVSSVFWPALSHADPNIAGTWSGTDSDGDAATFVFNEDKSAEVKLEGVPLLSSKTMTNGYVVWSGDTNQEPMLLNIVIFSGSSESGRIPLVAQIVNQRTLKIQLPRDMTTRLREFTESEDVFQIMATKQEI